MDNAKRRATPWVVLLVGLTLIPTSFLMPRGFIEANLGRFDRPVSWVNTLKGFTALGLASIAAFGFHAGLVLVFTGIFGLMHREAEGRVGGIQLSRVGVTEFALFANLFAAVQALPHFLADEPGVPSWPLPAFGVGVMFFFGVGIVLAIDRLRTPGRRSHALLFVLFGITPYFVRYALLTAAARAHL